MLVLAGGCGTLAVWSEPEKTQSATRQPAAERADTLFWRTLTAGLTRSPVAHGAQGRTSRTRTTVTAARRLHAHLAARGARDPIRAGPRDHRRRRVARKYFEEAVRLDPGDARYSAYARS
jgi:hypothetical protein